MTPYGLKSRSVLRMRRAVWRMRREPYFRHDGDLLLYHATPRRIVEQVMAGFHQFGQEELLAPYAERYFQALEPVWETRDLPDALAFGADADTVRTALEALSNIGAGMVVVTKNGDTYTKDKNQGGCSVTCQLPHFCGDKQVDSAFGEQCDLGDSNGQKVDVGGGKMCVKCDENCMLVIEC